MSPECRCMNPDRNCASNFRQRERMAVEMCRAAQASSVCAWRREDVSYARLTRSIWPTERQMLDAVTLRRERVITAQRN